MKEEILKPTPQNQKDHKKLIWTNVYAIKLDSIEEIDKLLEI